MTLSPALEPGRPPQRISPDLWLFPPNRDCMGGSSWFLNCTPEPILIDCPPLTEATLSALRELAAGRAVTIVLTSREGHGRVRRLQDQLGWSVLVQEQEAYLLPGVDPLQTFANEHITASGARLLWTPGPTPGSCVVHAPEPWNVLFCGRLLVPVAVGALAGLQHRRTFHWPRQQRSLERLQAWVSSDPLPSLASGAGLGALRGEQLVPWSGWRHHSTDGAQPIGSA